MPFPNADATCQPREEKLYNYFGFGRFVLLMYLASPSFFHVLGKNILFKLQHYGKI